MADIFISYTREDREKVVTLAKTLGNHGWSVWWDRTIPAGKTWREVIGEALESARSIVVIWSKTSVKSRWVQEEADWGLDRKILIPILIDEVRLPLGFGAVQAVDLINWDPAQSSPEFEKLISDISAILGPSPRNVKDAEQKGEKNYKQRKEEERRKAEEELHRLEKENRRITEERRRFEEEQKLIDVKRKAEEERKQKEAEANLKASEEELRTEREELRRKSDEARSFRGATDAIHIVEEEDKFHQMIAGKIETKKTDNRHLNTDEKANTFIDVAPKIQVMQPLVLTSIGWGIGWLFGWVFLGGIGAIGGATSYAIGGLATVIALRWIGTHIQLKEAFFIIVGWAVGGAICGTIYREIGGLLDERIVGIVAIMGGAIGYAIGGLATVMALRWIGTHIQLKEAFLIPIGWAVGGAIGGAIGGTRLWSIGMVISWPIGGVIAGVIGGGVMFELLAHPNRGN